MLLVQAIVREAAALEEVKECNEGISRFGRGSGGLGDLFDVRILRADGNWMATVPRKILENIVTI